MFILRRKWNVKCGMLAVACLGFYYQGCSSRYQREKEFQDELFYTSNPYKSANYRRQEFEALLMFKTTDELDKFVKNLSVRLRTWVQSDHYKVLFQHEGEKQPIDIWRRYRQDYLDDLEKHFSHVNDGDKLAALHDAMGEIFKNPYDYQRQQALIERYKFLNSEGIRKRISDFYFDNFFAKSGDKRKKVLRQSLLNFYLLMDFVYGGNRALEWCSAIKQVDQSLQKWTCGNCSYAALWEQVYKDHQAVLPHDPVWQYEKNRNAVKKFVVLSDRLIKGESGNRGGVFALTFKEVQSVIPYGVLLLSKHLDHLDQGNENVKQLRELCDLFRPIAMA